MLEPVTLQIAPTVPVTRWRDLRAWLAQVEAFGQVLRLDGVDWKLEMGALAEVAFHETQAQPALLLDNIQGYPSGYRILVNPVGSRERLALTLGLPLGLSDREMVRQLRARLRSVEPVPCATVDEGPVFENVQRGDQVDLFSFPSPLWHEPDGGRYIGTGDFVITRDPDDGWINSGTYRLMVHDRNTLGIYMMPNAHGAVHMRKYFARGEPCPVVIGIGSDPLLFVVSCSTLPGRVCELEYAGGLRGEPVQVIPGPVTGLPIPAHAEIVLEGEILPEYREEGPFGEFHGYYASGARSEPIVRVKAVYHRDSPIMLGVPPLRPPSDNTFIGLYMRPGLIWNALDAAGVPDVTGIWGHGGVSLFFIAVSIRQRYPGHAKQVGLMVSQNPASAHLNRFVVVVDDDIDVTDADQVLWAMGTRCDPETQVDLFRKCISASIDPAATRAQDGVYYNSRMVIDACRPFERLSTYPPVISTPPGLRDEVMRRYGELLRGH